MNPIEFYTGTKEQFQSLNPPNDDSIYFITDTQEIYKGSVKYAGDTSELTKIISEESTSDQIVLAKSLESEEKITVYTKEYIDNLIGGVDVLARQILSKVDISTTVQFKVSISDTIQNEYTKEYTIFPGESIVLTAPEGTENFTIQYWEKYYEGNTTTIQGDTLTVEADNDQIASILVILYMS